MIHAVSMTIVIRVARQIARGAHRQSELKFSGDDHLWIKEELSLHPFREFDDANNSLQNPKLGDWAVIDLSIPPGNRWPGKIAAAGVFDEEWR